MALWTVDRRAEVRALRNSPEADRHQRTLENVRTICAGDTRYRLEGYCRHQAELLLALPECDAACKALVASYRQRATR